MTHFRSQKTTHAEKFINFRSLSIKFAPRLSEICVKFRQVFFIVSKATSYKEKHFGDGNVQK
jgi:hypothetical protein